MSSSYVFLMLKLVMVNWFNRTFLWICLCCHFAPFDISVGVGAFVIGLGKISFLSFNNTINDISVIYVTARRCAGGLKKLDIRSRAQHHRHFVGFLNLPVKGPTRGQRFCTIIPRNRPI